MTIALQTLEAQVHGWVVTVEFYRKPSSRMSASSPALSMSCDPDRDVARTFPSTTETLLPPFTRS